MKKFFSSLIILFTLVNYTNAEYLTDLIVTSPTGIWTDNRAYNSIADAVTAIGSNNQTLVIASPQTVTDLTIPSNISLKFTSTGMITYSGHLVINSSIVEATDHQILDATGSGEADFARGAVLRSTWFEDLHEMFDQTVDNYVTLIICSGWLANVDADCQVGDDVILRWEGPGNRIVINSGFTLSNIKNIEAGNFQVFSGSGDFDFLDGTKLYLSWFNRLRSVITWVETEEVEILVSGEHIIDYSDTVTRNEKIIFLPGGSFNLSAGVTLTVNYFEAGRYQIFSGSGTVSGNGLDFDLIYPEWWGAIPDNSTDSTDAINNAISFSFTTYNSIVNFTSGKYLVTDQINLHYGTKLEGVNIDYGGAAGLSDYTNNIADARGTVIVFNPSVQTSLFVPILPLGGSNAYSAIAIKNMSLWGNSTPDDYHRILYGLGPAVTTSLYGIDFSGVHYSKVENVSIQKFVTGVRLGEKSQVNTFNNVFISYCGNQCVLYDDFTAVEPSGDLWNGCIFRISAIAIEQSSANPVPSGDSLHIRFHGCYFEDLSDHLAVISKGAKDWMFIDCYGEAIGIDTTVTDRSAFQIGKIGSSTGNNTNNLTIIGGQYAGLSIVGGVFLDTDLFDNIRLIGTEAKRFATAITTTANARLKGIYLSDFTCIAPTLYSGTAGVLVGSFRTSSLDAGNDIHTVRTDYVVSESELNLAATTIRAGDGSTTSMRPGGNGTEELGLNGTRWSNTYSNKFYPGTGSAFLTSGSGTPEGSVTAPVGSIYLNTSGGAGYSFYVKETGVGNTGWVSK